MPGMKLTKLVYISPEDMDELVQYWDFYQCEDEEAPERLDDSGEYNLYGAFENDV